MTTMTPIRKSLAFALAIPMASAALAGCGGSGPPLVKVTGTVTINGKPYEGALIQFVPDAGNATGLEAVDVTGPSGNYMVRTAGRTGVPSGKYNVVISPAPASMAAGGMAGMEGDTPTPENDPSQMEAMMMSGMTGESAQNQTEAERPTRSFAEEVPAEETVLDFDIKT